MNFQVKITEYAKNDLKIAYEFYDFQKTGLGKYFLDIILSEIELLEVYGCLHQKIFGYNRMISKKFPFGIYYECDKKEKNYIYNCYIRFKEKSKINRKISTKKEIKWQIY